jgi:hypothetical protein
MDKIKEKIMSLLKKYIIDNFPYTPICFECNKSDCLPNYYICDIREKYFTFIKNRRKIR